MTNKILYFLLLPFFLPLSLQAQQWEWDAFTNADEIRKMAGQDSVIWCATNGGVLRFSTNTLRFKKFTNTDGLSKNDIRTIALDKNGNIWAADDEGLLNFYNIIDKTWEIKSHYKDQIINYIYPYGDSLFIGFNEGVSLFIPNPKDPQNWEVKETYYIGRTNGIVVSNGTLWAALNESVKAASLDFPNLQAPTAWVEYRAGFQLPGTAVRSVFSFKSTIYVTTNSGISFFNGAEWSQPELNGENILALSSLNGELLAASTTSLYQKSDDGSWRNLSSGDFVTSDLLVDEDGTIWLGTNKSIAYFASDNNEFITLKLNGPVDNKFNALTFDRDGNLWAASSKGVSIFDGSNWKTFDKSFGLNVGNSFRALEVDPDNRIWAASWGGGISIFEKLPSDGYAIQEINSAENRLAGIQSNPDYVVTTGLMADADGNMWILNYLADNKNVVAVVGPQGNWQYFSTLEGIHSTRVLAIEIDSQGRKWIGTENAGISVIDDGGTPFDKSDDDLSQGLKTEDGLESEQIRCIAEDLDGVIWIGTPEGLYYWFDGQIFPKYGTINDDINSILVDAANNKWIGTSGGLTRLYSDGFQMSHFSTDDSPLPADNITAFAFNEQSGDIFIGTTNGLVRLRTPFTKPASTLSLVGGYPNPFVLDGPQSQFTIDNLAAESSVNIFTAEGVHVRQFTREQIFGARVAWDGRNDKGNVVTSGVYVYLVTTQKGLAKTGKVAVINP